MDARSRKLVALFAVVLACHPDTAAISRTRAEALANVGAYLRGRTITEVTDLDPPRIDVASDGRSATLVGHVRIRGTARGEPFVVRANTEGP